MQRSLRRSFRWAWVFVAAIAALALLLRSEEERRSAEVRRVREVARLARQAYLLAVDRETSVRGFLLTGAPASLEPDLEARVRLAPKLDSLERLIEVPRQLQRVREAAAHLTRWEREFADPAIAGTSATALPALAGKPLFDPVRHSFEEFLAAEDSLYTAGVAAHRRTAWLGAATLLVALAALAMLLRNFRRGLEEQAGALLEQQEQLELQAVELEAQTSDLEERTMQLASSNAELEAFAYTVAHDLRAPLRSVDGYAHAVLEDAAARLDAEQVGFLERIRVNTRRMAQMIDGLLALSRIRRAELRRERVDLTALAREAERDLRVTEPRRNVRLEVDPGLEADGDPRLLAVALQNLLGNAWKFTRQRAVAEIRFGASRDGDGRPVYFIRDNGSGFANADAERLFAPFTRLHSSSGVEGTGIGLATARRVIEAHGGRIWAEGDAGRGATFHFTLRT